MADRDAPNYSLVSDCGLLLGRLWQGKKKRWGFSSFATCSGPSGEPFPDGRAKVGELYWSCWHVEKKLFVMPLLQSGIHERSGTRGSALRDVP